MRLLLIVRWRLGVVTLLKLCMHALSPKRYYPLLHTSSWCAHLQSDWRGKGLQSSPSRFKVTEKFPAVPLLCLSQNLLELVPLWEREDENGTNKMWREVIRVPHAFQVENRWWTIKNKWQLVNSFPPWAHLEDTNSTLCIWRSVVSSLVAAN